MTSHVILTSLPFWWLFFAVQLNLCKKKLGGLVWYFWLRNADWLLTGNMTIYVANDSLLWALIDSFCIIALLKSVTNMTLTWVKADFFSQARSKIEIYQSKLKFTNVGKSICENKNVQEDFVSSQFLLDWQERINFVQHKRFASKL